MCPFSRSWRSLTMQVTSLESLSRNNDEQRHRAFEMIEPSGHTLITKLEICHHSPASLLLLSPPQFSPSGLFLLLFLLLTLLLDSHTPLFLPRVSKALHRGATLSLLPSVSHTSLPNKTTSTSLHCHSFIYIRPVHLYPSTSFLPPVHPYLPLSVQLSSSTVLIHVSCLL